MIKTANVHMRNTFSLFVTVDLAGRSPTRRIVRRLLRVNSILMKCEKTVDQIDLRCLMKSLKFGARTSSSVESYLHTCLDKEAEIY